VCVCRRVTKSRQVLAFRTNAILYFRKQYRRRNGPRGTVKSFYSPAAWHSQARPEVTSVLTVSSRNTPFFVRVFVLTRARFFVFNLFSVKTKFAREMFFRGLVFLIISKKNSELETFGCSYCARNKHVSTYVINVF